VSADKYSEYIGDHPDNNNVPVAKGVMCTVTQHTQQDHKGMKDSIRNKLKGLKGIQHIHIDCSSESDLTKVFLRVNSTDSEGK
jgi:translation elongation factor EF-1beta